MKFDLGLAKGLGRAFDAIAIGGFGPDDAPELLQISAFSPNSTFGMTSAPLFNLVAIAEAFVWFCSS